MLTTDITRDTTLCISLSGRPSNLGTRFHNFLYDELGLDYIYRAFTTTDIAAAVGGIRALGIRGAGISMPFKAAVIPLIDSLDDSASVIESVNTIVNTDGHLRGYNTDYSAVATLLDERASADRRDSGGGRQRGHGKGMRRGAPGSWEHVRDGARPHRGDRSRARRGLRVSPGRRRSPVTRRRSWSTRRRSAWPVAPMWTPCPSRPRSSGR